MKLEYLEPAKTPNVSPKSSLKVCTRSTYISSLHLIRYGRGMVLKEHEERSVLEEDGSLHYLHVRCHAGTYWL